MRIRSRDVRPPEALDELIEAPPSRDTERHAGLDHLEDRPGVVIHPAREERVEAHVPRWQSGGHVEHVRNWSISGPA